MKRNGQKANFSGSASTGRFAASLRRRVASGLAQGLALAALASIALSGQTARSQEDSAETPELAVDTSSREETRDFYRSVFGASEAADLGWTGNYFDSDPVAAAGSTSPDFRQAVLLRVNFFRAMAGLPANVQLDDALNAPAQQAALMMSGSDALSHQPSAAGFSAYATELGDYAAARSNLAIGTLGPAAITCYMRDDGPENRFVGHRQWLLNPALTAVGTGDLPGGAAPDWALEAADRANGAADKPQRLRSANALFLETAGNPVAPDASAFVAYPPEGYVPYPVVFARWSLSLPGADLSRATVEVYRDGVPLTVRSESDDDFLLPTLVWTMDTPDWDSEAATRFSRPLHDIAYDVRISDIQGWSRSSLAYRVTVFDPDVASPQSTTTQAYRLFDEENGQTSFVANTPVYAPLTRWRTFAVSEADLLWGAESSDEPVVAATSGNYPLTTTYDAANGRASYHLAQPDNREQSFELPRSYLVSEGAFIHFLSKLGWTTEEQIASFDISLDDGLSWSPLLEIRGNDGPGSERFESRLVELDRFAGRTARFRFRLRVEPELGPRYDLVDPWVGWLIDEIAASGLALLSEVETSEPAIESVFHPPLRESENRLVQVQGLLAPNLPLEWSPAQPIALGTPAADIAIQASN